MIMTSIATLIVLLLVMHECTTTRAHPLDVTRTSGLLSTKDVEKSSVHDIATPLKVMPQIETEKSESRAPEAKGGTVSMDSSDIKDQEEMKAKPSMASSNRKMLRGNVVISSAPRAVEETTEIKDSKGLPRTMPESTSHKGDKPTGGPIEDLEVMDYTLPNRKPPIHNHEP
ncbi:hypothetical protein Droror1_Dr00027181 [Drosera rotundifolia]